MAQERDKHVFGYQDLVATFEEADLAIPPIPMVFRGVLRRFGRWLWSTRPIKAMSMYMMREYPEEPIEGRIPDYIAISHAGHGMNSYGLNYFLMYGPLAVFAQDAWGGAFSDPLRSRESVAETFAMLRPLVALVEASEPELWSDAPRVVMEFSSFRRTQILTVLRASEQESGEQELPPEIAAFLESGEELPREIIDALNPGAGGRERVEASNKEELFTLTETALREALGLPVREEPSRS